ncbi:MAG: PorT family protein, partial [Bacteroidia bacterium]|nr:PorT family protein [Bacteroidia bacterium]
KPKGPVSDCFSVKTKQNLGYLYPMKLHRSVFILSLFLITLNSFSQEEGASFFIRPTIGLVGSQIDGDQLAGYRKAGALAGAMVGRNFTDKFTASFGLLFIQKGARKNANVEAGDYLTYRLNINYIDVPFQFTKKFRALDLYAGVTYSQLISHKESSTDFGFYNSANKIHSFDLGWMLGAERKLPNDWYFGIRFNYSIIPMRDFFKSPAQPELLYYNIWGTMFRRGFYNNLLIFYFSKEINPRKKSE